LNRFLRKRKCNGLSSLALGFQMTHTCSANWLGRRHRTTKGDQLQLMSGNTDLGQNTLFILIQFIRNFALTRIYRMNLILRRLNDSRNIF